MERTQVQSSNIESIGYDEQTRTLEVEFVGRGGKAGSIYQYANFPVALWHDFLQAPSKGHFFANHVKRLYPGTKVQ